MKSDINLKILFSSAHWFQDWFLRMRNYDKTLTCTAAFWWKDHDFVLRFFALDHGHLFWDCRARHDWFLRWSWLEWHWSRSRSSHSMEQVGNLRVSKKHLESEMATCFDGMSVCAGRGGNASMAPTASTLKSQSPDQSDLFPRNFPLLVWPWPWRCRGQEIDERDAGSFTRDESLAATHTLRWIA